MMLGKRYKQHLKVQCTEGKAAPSGLIAVDQQWQTDCNQIKAIESAQWTINDRSAL